LKYSRNSNLSKNFVVDDAEVVLQMTSDYFEARQYRVTKARSGVEFFRQVAEVMDGLKANRCIRTHADATIAATPMIALTALAMTGDRERCLAAGANEYMSKPVKLIELKKVIEDLSPSSIEANHE
jgi:CheY-like chemotaxis protein